MVDYLLKLSYLFENKAKRLLDRYLSKKADEVPPFISNSFKDSLQYLLKTNIDRNTFNKWAIKNKDSIGNLLGDSEWFSFAEYMELNTDNDNIRRICIMSNINITEENLKIKQSIYLKGEGVIPDLSFISGKRIFPSHYSAPLIDYPELTHNAFIIMPLTRFLGLRTPEEFNNFIETNKNKLEEIKKFFTETPKYLGGGADGIAFAVGANRVLKIFSSEGAYKEAEKAMMRIHKNPDIAKTEAMIYDAGLIGSKSDGLYYYIMERMNPISSLPNNVQDALEKIIIHIHRVCHSYVKEHPELRYEYSDPKQHVLLKNTIQSLINNILNSEMTKYVNQINIINDNLSLKENWLSLLIEEIIYKNISERTDLHLGNIGVTHYGELRFFDPVFI